MSIKAGQILHDAGTPGTTGSSPFVINRIQSAGPGNVNIPEEKIYELGNFETICTVRDIPDLSFDLESLSVSTEIEALLTHVDPDTVSPQQEFDFKDHKPIDIISPFKSALNQFDIVRGIATPQLTLERASYNFGLRQSATQQFTLRGDSIFYVPGQPYIEIFTVTAGVNQVYTLEQTSIVYVEDGDNHFVYNVCLKNSTDNTYKRLFLGTDYTNTATDLTILADWDTIYDEVHVTYGSATVDDGTSPGEYNQSSHKDATVQPCAIRGRNIDVYVSDGAGTPTLVRWDGVQSFETTWSVQIENDEEFGNSKFVNSDYDVAEVTGSIGVKSEDPADLWEKIANVAGVTTAVTAGALSSVPLELEVRLSDPDTGLVVKTFFVPDARFTVPSISGRIQTKLETTFSFTSDAGDLLVYEETR